MALNAGDADTPDTLAKAIYDQLDSEFGAAGTDELDADRKKWCKAVAKGIVNHITGFGEAVITTSDGGLQTSTTAGSETDAPGSEKTIGLQ